MSGVKPCVVGIVLATGIYLVISSCFDVITDSKMDLKAIVIVGILLIAMLGYKYVAKKKLSPIMLIVFSAVAGIVIYGI